MNRRVDGDVCDCGLAENTGRLVGRCARHAAALEADVQSGNRFAGTDVDSRNHTFPEPVTVGIFCCRHWMFIRAERRPDLLELLYEQLEFRSVQGRLEIMRFLFPVDGNMLLDHSRASGQGCGRNQVGQGRIAVGVVGIANRLAVMRCKKTQRPQVRVGGLGGKGLKAVHQYEVLRPIVQQNLQRCRNFFRRRGAGLAVLATLSSSS